MASFDLQTTPRTISLTAGESSTITVVVSNRMGQPVMARINHLVTPPEAAGWVTAPAEPQRRFDAEASATYPFEFTIAVPENAADTSFSFRADVFDVLAPDDHFARGETVSVDVAARVVEEEGGGVPWWVWVLVGVVVIGAGVGIWFAVGRQQVPRVVGRTPEAAESALRSRGFTQVNMAFELDSAMTLQADQVVSQEPPGGSKYQGDTVANLVVRQRTAEVPDVRELELGTAANQLHQAGLALTATPGTTCTTLDGKDGKVASLSPVQGTLRPYGDSVRPSLYVRAPPGQVCVYINWGLYTEVYRTTRRGLDVPPLNLP